MPGPRGFGGPARQVEDRMQEWWEAGAPATGSHCISSISLVGWNALCGCLWRNCNGVDCSVGIYRVDVTESSSTSSATGAHRLHRVDLNVGHYLLQLHAVGQDVWQIGLKLQHRCDGLPPARGRFVGRMMRAPRRDKPLVPLCTISAQKTAAPVEGGGRLAIGQVPGGKNTRVRTSILSLGGAPWANGFSKEV
jgi:hypothetical protein